MCCTSNHVQLFGSTDFTFENDISNVCICLIACILFLNFLQIYLCDKIIIRMGMLMPILGKEMKRMDMENKEVFLLAQRSMSSTMPRLSNFGFIQ